MFQGPRPYIVAARYFGDIDFSQQVYDCTLISWCMGKFQYCSIEEGLLVPLSIQLLCVQSG